MNFEFYSSIHIGLKRQSNQDALLVNEALDMAAVADGLGGHQGGEVASSMALSSFNENLEKASSNKNEKNFKKLIRQAFHKANDDVFSQNRKYKELQGMGTTLVALWLKPPKIYVANVGDSRGYLYKEKKLWQITDDHTLETQAIKHSFENQEDPARRSSVLTQSIGFLKSVKVDVFTLDAQKGDVYLLCSDGLHGMIPDQEILAVLNNEELKNVPFKCTMKALSKGGLDNISIVAVSIKNGS